MTFKNNKAKDTGGPAFPVESSGIGTHFGMTLRDYFAVMAMQSLCPELQPSQAASRAYAYADAMIEARDNEQS